MSLDFTAEHEIHLTMAQEWIRRIYAGDPIDEIQKWLTGRLTTAKPQEVNAVLSWAESFPFYDQVLTERAERSMQPLSKRLEFQWPYASWRRLIDTPDEGILVSVAAAPGTGKTIIAEMMGEGNARFGSHGSLFHLELNKKIMMDRRAVRQTYAHVDRRLLKRGLLTDEQIARLDEDFYVRMGKEDGLSWVDLSRDARQMLNEANERMQAWPGSVDYVHCPGWSVNQIEEYALAEQERRKDTDAPLTYIIIDYFGKIAATGQQLKMYGTNIYARDADTIERLKTLAEKMSIPVVILDQLSKAGRQTDLADFDGTQIRSAGEKTERINVGIMVSLTRDEDTGEPTEELRVKVYKNTMGSEGVITMRRKPEAFTILDIEPTELTWGSN